MNKPQGSQPSPTRDAAPPSRFQRLRAAVPYLAAAAALVHPLARALARLDWRADMLSHLQEAGLAATLIAILVLVRRHRCLAIALGVLAAFQAVPLLRYSGPNPVPAEAHAEAPVRILMSNVLADNTDHARLAALIRQVRPDVVGLVEVTDSWLEDLAEVAQEYPYRAEYPAGTRGLALWFRERPESVEGPLQLVGEGWPLLHALIRLDGQPTHLWLVHPASPLRHQRRHAGYPELDALARRIGATEGPQIVVGDLNSTDGSPHFGDFLRTTGLRDSRLGFGRQPSWPVWSPYRIAIDHAFLSPDVAVVDRRLGPDIGSDHRPLILDVAPAARVRSASRLSTQGSQASP